MAEYIKREDVMNIISQRVNNPTIVTWINGIISTVPAVNIEEIKCGEWIKIPITDIYNKASLPSIDFGNENEADGEWCLVV